jgi:RNA polymerase sigma-70 factor, ECF subfamily
MFFLGRLRHLPTSLKRRRVKVSEAKKERMFRNDMVPHMDLLFNYALYLTGDREEAKDLLQETFLKAFRFFDRFKEGTNARAWLYRIMRNTFINEYRRVKRTPSVVEFDEQVTPSQMLPQDPRQSTDLRERIDAEMFEDEVAVAISALPEKFKSVIVLRDVEDLPYEEIAEALDIPVGTVRSRLHRARVILSDALSQYARSKGYEVGRQEVSAEYALSS